MAAISRARDAEVNQNSFAAPMPLWHPDDRKSVFAR
jgi:hypothetical protein